MSRFESCELCGEPLDGRGNGTAEMYDPSWLTSIETLEDQDSVICHADCGLARGYDIA